MRLKLRSFLSIVRRSVLQIDYIAYPRFVVPLVGLLTPTIAYGVALVRSDIRYRLGEPSRREILFSLTVLYGDRLDDERRERIARDYFRMRSCEPVDAMRLLGNGKAMLSLVKVVGDESLKATLAGGKGGILCSAHYGSHKSCFSMLGALGYPVNVVARWNFGTGKSSKWIGARLQRLVDGRPVTTHMKRPIIERKAGNYAVAVQTARALRQNEFVAIMLDHEVYPGDPSKPEAFEFLGRKALLVPGAAAISKVTGAPLLMMISRRSNDWRHQTIEVSSPQTVKGDPASSFKECLAQVEAAIWKQPSQWQRLRPWDLVHMGIVPRELVLAKPWRKQS